MGDDGAVWYHSGLRQATGCGLYQGGGQRRGTNSGHLSGRHLWQLVHWQLNHHWLLTLRLDSQRLALTLDL